MKDMYDVFISYRHESGSYVARHLADVLSRDGYTVFLDKESLKDQNRPFECVLYEKIVHFRVGIHLRRITSCQLQKARTDAYG